MNIDGRSRQGLLRREILLPPPEKRAEDARVQVFAFRRESTAEIKNYPQRPPPEGIRLPLVLCLTAERELPRDLALTDGAEECLGGFLAEAASGTVLAVLVNARRARSLSERHPPSREIAAIADSHPPPPNLEAF